MNRTQFSAVLVGIGLFSISFVCWSSGIYKLVDEQGRVTYTNTPTKEASKLRSLALGSSPTLQVVTKAETSITAPVDSYPKISLSRQQQRDIWRRQILERELMAEIKLLEHVLQTLEATIRDLEKRQSHAEEVTINTNDVQQLRSQVILHKRNIQALKIELKNF